MSAKVYADATIWSILDKTVLDQTPVSPIQIIKHGLELGEDNEDVLKDRQQDRPFTISGTQTFSNFISFEVYKLNPALLLSIY